MNEEVLEKLCLYGLSLKYPRNWKIVIGSKQLSFESGKINIIGLDILMGIIWEKSKKEISLEDYEKLVINNLKKKDKKGFKLIKKENREISGHQAFFEIMETRGRSGFIGMRKDVIEHIHCIFFCENYSRFVTVYVTLIPELKEEYNEIINKIFSSLECIHQK